MRREILVGLTTMTLLSVGTGCNRRVFQEVLPVCETTLASEAQLSAEKAADILIVVDNSGSMQEEQDRLAAAFINTDESECPLRSDDLKDFARCDEASPPDICRFSNPSTELLAKPGSEGGLSQCGFIQVLAAFENDFRIGVITTDVGACDNRLPGAMGGTEWGARPQRGCLQPNGPPGTGLKIIAREDLLDDDGSNDDIGARFIATLANIRTYGSAVERGLDAAVDFLDPATPRDESCSNDLAAFVRDDAKLLVIFLTDEEDCSRSNEVGTCARNDGCGPCENPEGCDVFACPIGQSCEPGRPEFVTDVCTRPSPDDLSVRQPAANCYEYVDQLTPVQHYVDALKAKKPNSLDVSVAVVAGGLPDADGNIVAGGCNFDAATRQPVGGCDPSGGNSNNINECPAERNCCVADPGNRYFDLATAFGAAQGLKDTICVDSFGQTMIKIAVFIADVDSLKLAEPPADQSLIVVEKAAENSDVFTQVPRATGTSCDGAGNGWVLQEDGVTIRFCGSARPLPGDQIRVAAAGKGANGSGPDACEERGNTRN